MIQKIKELIRYANEHGLQMPMAHDPKKGRASVSLTLLFVSSITVIVSLFSSVVPILQGMNFWQSLAFYVTSAMLYYGRGGSISEKGITIEAGNDQEEG